jgi:hypothetical protein
MFTHYGNSVLRGQTFISPTQITSLNHQKFYKFIRGNHTNFVAISQLEQVRICNMLQGSQKNFLFLWFFAALESHNDNNNKWNLRRETNANVGIGPGCDTCACSLCSNKLACGWSWTCVVCAVMPPVSITCVENDNPKVRDLNDGPTLCKRF